MGNPNIFTTVSTWPSNMTSSLIHSWARSDDSYSGDWNTCSTISRKIKVADRYTESAKKKAYKMMENEVLPMRSCNVYDMGIDHYEVWSVVPEKVQKVKPKYKEMYVLCTGNTDIETADTLPEAKEKAAKIILERRNYHIGDYSSIFIKKKKVLIGGTESVAACKLNIKTYKSKPKSIKAGSILREIHQYAISGMAKD